MRRWAAQFGKAVPLRARCEFVPACSAIMEPLGSQEVAARTAKTVQLPPPAARALHVPGSRRGTKPTSGPRIALRGFSICRRAGRIRSSGGFVSPGGSDRHGVVGSTDLRRPSRLSRTRACGRAGSAGPDRVVATPLRLVVLDTRFRRPTSGGAQRPQGRTSCILRRTSSVGESQGLDRDRHGSVRFIIDGCSSHLTSLAVPRASS